MRKCRSCGYLLLGEGDACNRCGTPLPVVTAGAPAAPAAEVATPAPAASWPPAPPVAASGAGTAPLPSFGRLSIPPPTGTRPTVGSTPSAAPQQAFRETWQPATITTPPAAQPRSTRLGVVAVAIAISLAVGGAVLHFRPGGSLPAGTSAFVAGGGVTYTSPDGAYQVQLPQTPTSDQRTITVNSVSATIYTAIVSTDNYEMGAASIVLPTSVPADRINAALDDAMSEGIKSSNGKLVHKDLTRRGALPAIEGQFKAPDGYSAHVLVVSSGSRLIMLIVHSKSGTDQLYKALEASLIVQ